MSAPAAPALIGFEAPAVLPPAKPRSRHGSEKRRRGEAVRVRFDADELARLDGRASAAGLSLPAFMRACSLGDAGPRARRRPPIEREELARLGAELGRVGNNVNQLAHAMNRGDDVLRATLASTAAELRDTLAEIRRALGRDRQG